MTRVIPLLRCVKIIISKCVQLTFFAFGTGQAFISFYALGALNSRKSMEKIIYYDKAKLKWKHHYIGLIQNIHCISRSVPLIIIINTTESKSVSVVQSLFSLFHRFYGIDAIQLVFYVSPSHSSRIVYTRLFDK